MTPKQAAFVREYLIDRNATQAAIRAGYSADTAYSIGHENLNKPDIASAIADAEKKLQAKAEMTVERVAQMLLDDRDMARELGQPSAAVTAAMGVAKLYGLIIDKSQNENRSVIVNELDDATLTHIASSGGTGVAEPKGGKKEPSQLH